MNILSRIAVVCMCLLVCGAALAEPRSGRPISTLRGEVVTADGKPITGARVGISTAAPREGPAYYCPGCYRDCSKSAMTDERGAFSIGELDDSLKFTLCITRDDFSPLNTGFINPDEGPRTGEKALRLTARDWSTYTPKQIVRGRVVDASGNPIAYAVVDGFGFYRKDGTGLFGTVAGLDPTAVSDKEGRFKIGYTEEVESIAIAVNANAHARGLFPKLATGDIEHTLTLTEGVAVQARLTQFGKPLGDVEVALYGTSRSSFFPSIEHRLATGPDGSVLFTNLRPETDLWIYTKMDSAKKFSARAKKKIRTGLDGTTLDVGELLMAPAFRVSGRIVGEPGSPVAAGQVFLSSQEGWDDQVMSTGPRGEFSFGGVPLGQYMFSFAPTDRRLALSPANASYPFPGATYLSGRVDADINGLEILVVNKNTLPPRPRNTQAWERPLEGVE